MPADSSAEPMKCSYCGTTTTVSTDGNPVNNAPKLNSFPFGDGGFEKLWEQAQSQAGEMSTVRCGGCNSTISSNQEVSACPFCGSTQIVKSSGSTPPSHGNFPDQTLGNQLQAVINEWTANPGVHVTKYQTVISSQQGQGGGQYLDSEKTLSTYRQERKDNPSRTALQVIILVVLVMIIGLLVAMNFHS